mmetsp:Transcript_13372/g.16039  ORF Transcript_13372/g.16039 Transcript_13372/m.16039 type:complete len:152 (-) Transcript_13372:94-549(-)
MILASCFEDFSFVPMDRHLNKGWRHFCRSAAAQRCFVHEFSSHCIAQLVFADLLRRCGPLWSLGPSIYGAVVIQACYALMVLTAASMISPHGLPYKLGTVPKFLRFPVPCYWIVLGCAGYSSTVQGCSVGLFVLPNSQLKFTATTLVDRFF